MRTAGAHAPVLLSLQEYKSVTRPRNEIPVEVGETLWSDFSEQLQVDFPSRRTGDRWKITATGWVGHIAVGSGHAVRIEPKVPIGSLFRMLEYAYGLEAFRFSDRLVGTGSIDDFFNELARLLAKNVLRRTKQGLFRSYRSRDDRLSFVRGRMDLSDALRRPHDVRKRCVFQENTADVADNQILLWTLRRILSVPMLGSQARQDVQHAYRTLKGAVSVVPFEGRDCRGRLYSRLNKDYAPLHALCGFFLDHTGPVHTEGGRSAIPFLINMWELFEGFVTEWLRRHLPGWVELGDQVGGYYDPGRNVEYRIDVLLRERSTASPMMVVDTKYKEVSWPKAEDVAQVVSYAVRLGAPNAMLVYPGRSAPYDFRVGDVTVTSAFISLEDPEAGAAALLDVIEERWPRSTGADRPSSSPVLSATMRS